jgi:regulator of sirC expression with transglutaminase-like and TPR domain
MHRHVFHRGAACADRSAQADLTRCLALKPDDGKAYYARGLTRSKLGDQPGAIADLERALRLFTDQGDAADAQLAREALHRLGQ